MDIKKIEVPIEKIIISIMTKYFRITNNENSQLSSEDIKGRENILKEVKVNGLFLWIDTSKDNNHTDYIKNLISNSQIDEPNHKKVLLYILSVETPESKEETQLQAYIKDSWQLATLDAAEEYFKEIQSITNAKIIGPGYETMDLKETKALLRILKAESINVVTNDQFVLVPAKSIIKMAIPVDQKNIKATQCENCKGNKKNCNYC